MAYHYALSENGQIRPFTTIKARNIFIKANHGRRKTTINEVRKLLRKNKHL